MDNIKLKETFIEYFGDNGKEMRIFTAPGRVNLIGEHTDYNGGYVFPAAITMSSTVVARKREDRIIRLLATDLKVMVEVSLDELQENKNLKWGSYQLGVADELQKAGYSLNGCDILYHDTVPLKSGLSSSAAIEVVTAFALLSLSNEENMVIDPKEVAIISQKAENNFIGVKCGIMDQFASAMGKKDHAIILDCRDLSYSHVPLKLDGYKIVISNTNNKRSLANSKYNERRNECDRGLEFLKKAFKDAVYLSDIDVAGFEQHKDLITNAVVKNRVSHVIYENARVLNSVKALKSNNISEFGKLMIKSHESLRELYEVTGRELDALVECALSVDGVAGSRMTGAGFGGCTVSIVKDNAVNDFIEKVSEGYQKKTNIEPSFYVTDAGDGVRELI